MGDRPYSRGEREGTLRVRAVVLLISNGCVALNDFVHRMGRGGLEGGGGDPPVLYNQTCIPQETNITIEQLFRRKEISKLLYPAKESGADDSEEKPTRDC